MASQLISIPTDPPRPNGNVYGIESLNRVKLYTTRAAFIAAFGVNPASYDPSRKLKYWFDSSVDPSNPSTPYEYSIIGQDSSGSWGLIPQTITALEASSVNLPGLVPFPSYVVAPTQAARAAATINPTYLSLKSDAQALMNLVGGSNLIDEGTSSIFPVTYPTDEPRRMWDFTFNGRIYNVGNLLQDSNANGVGAPGHWDTDPTATLLTWVPDAAPSDGANDTRPPVPPPVRALLPGESIYVGLMGESVLYTDPGNPPAQEGSFTSDDRATLQKIYQILSKLGIQ